MAEARPTEERIAELDKKIEQIKAQKKAILQREKQAERKARTKRLIQIGAEVEAVCGEITDLEAFKDYLSKYSYAIKKTQEPKPDTSADAFVNSYDDFMKNTSVYACCISFFPLDYLKVKTGILSRVALPSA